MHINPSSIIGSLHFLLASSDFVELKAGQGLKLDLRYASENNFVGINMYGPFNRAFLHKISATKLAEALKLVKAQHPNYGFVIFDALRPRSVQRVLWSHVVGTEGEKYIANPDLGSLHNFGFAVDLSIIDDKGQELDMGAGYDDFRPVAQPQLEDQMLAEGKLTPKHIANRKLLRNAMETAGFTQLKHEWWHYDALPKDEVRANFQIVD